MQENDFEDQEADEVVLQEIEKIIKVKEWIKKN